MSVQRRSSGAPLESENCFILENNVIQHGVKIEDNVYLWSGNHIGHQTAIHRNTYIASHAVISGFCEIGANCFVGVNAAFNDKVKVGEDCISALGRWSSKTRNLEKCMWATRPNRLVEPVMKLLE